MFQTVDLHRRLCQDLRLVAHVTLPAQVKAELFEGTYVHEPHKGAEYRAATYGSVYHKNKRPHVVSAYILEAGQGAHIEFRYTTGDADPPPSDIKAARRAAAILADWQSDVEFECTAIFLYEAQEQLISRVTVPIRLRKPISPFTHIESLSLSDRQNGSLKQSLRLEVTDESIRHTAFLRLNGSFADNVPSKGLAAAARLSKGLLRQRK